MDPLSAAASILAVLTAAGQVGKGLKLLWELKAAPDEVASLLNEISNWRMLLLVIQKGVENCGLTEDRMKDVLSMIRILATQCCRTLNELDEMVSEGFRQSGSRVDVSKVFFLRQRHKLRLFHENLRDQRQQLTIALTTFNSIANITSTQKILLAIETLAFLRQDEARLATNVCEPGDGSSMPKYSNLEEFLKAGGMGRSDESIPSHTGYKDTQLSPVHIVTRMIPDSCPAACLCTCHRHNAFRTPLWLTRIIGRLFISSPGMRLIPFCKPHPCSLPSCLGSNVSTARLDYYFPTWLMFRVLSVVGRWTLSGLATSWHFRMPRVVPDDSLILHAVNSGNKQSIANLIQAGEASLYDVDTEGDSLLWYAINRRNWGLALYLMDAGLEWDQQNRAGCSPGQEALYQLLGVASSHVGDEKRDSILAVTRADETLESFGFTQLHLSVLGLSRDSVGTYFNTATKHANVRDAWGMTPLHWACLRGDQTSTDLLLHLDANPNITDMHQNSPIQEAVHSAHTKIAISLINAGAEAGNCNRWGNTPLHRAARRDGPNVACISLLIKACPETIDKANMWKQTALHIAAFYGHVDNVIFLAQQGADLNAVDVLGETAIFKSIENDKPETTRFLVKRGCCLDVENAQGTHLLAHVALHASTSQMKIVVPAVLARVGLEKTRALRSKAWILFNGERATKCYSSRRPIEEERVVFAALLGLNAQTLSETLRNDFDDDGDSQYESASEY